MPLNRSLHSRLVELFGRVGIANEGDAGSDALVRRPGGGQQLHLNSFGESYKVACPFCSDHKPRLWINWRYGQPDPTRGSRFPINYLCRCFNEDCVPDNQGNRLRLADEILGFRNRAARNGTGAWIVRPGRPMTTMTQTAPPPGNLVGLSQLPDAHPAVAYLFERGFDRDVFVRYGLSYCTQAVQEHWPAQGRIICPVDFGGTRVGWQARYLGTPADRRTPKYYSLPGMPKSRILYNFDRAMRQPFIVVVEGITDVWRVGDPAVAIFGHDISHQQQNLLRQFSGGIRPVLVMLDGMEQERTQGCAAELRNMGIPARAVHLPPQLDPADCSADALGDFLVQQLGCAGFCFH